MGYLSFPPPTKYYFIISDSILATYDNTVYITQESYTKLKEYALIKLSPSPALMRIPTAIYTGDVSTTYIKIYKNGVAYGPEHSRGPTGPGNFSDDLSFSEGDTVELWGRVSNALYPQTNTTFQIRGTRAIATVTSSGGAFTETH